MKGHYTKMNAFIALLWLSLTVAPSAYATVTCRELIDQLAQQFEAQHRQLPQVSLAEAHPNIAESFETLLPTPIDYTVYLREFLQTNNRAPTLREAIEFSYEARRDLHDQYDRLIEEYSRLSDSRLSLFIDELKLTRNKLPKFSDLDRLQADVVEQAESGRRGLVESLDVEIPLIDRGGVPHFDEDYYRFLLDRTGFGNYNGEYGELYAILHTRGEIISRGLKVELSVPETAGLYQREMSQRLELLKENLLSSDMNQLRAIVNEHSNGDAGLLRFVKNFMESASPDELSVEEVATRIVQALANKEIDIVAVSPSGRVTWGEVKAYHKGFTRENLSARGGKNKSIYEQLIEHRSVAQLLGLEGRVDFVFISPTSNVDQGGRELLRAIGFEVLDP